MNVWIFFNSYIFLSIEYCKTRALPTVQKSEYLNTLGCELHKDIDVMWTGECFFQFLLLALVKLLSIVRF